MRGSPENRIKAVDNALDILDALAKLGSGGVTELTDEVNVSKSAVYKHLATLEARGYVARSGSDSYELGLPWLTYGGHARKRALPFQRIQTAVKDIADETGELVVFAAFSGESTMPLYQVRGEHAVTTDSHAGAELPVHATATGKAILAAMGEDSMAVLDAVELEQYTENTVTDRAALETDLEEIRERGFSLEDEERIEGMRGAGAAVANENTGEVVGAFALTAPRHRLRGDRFREAVPELIANRAREVEINITYEDE